MLDTGAGQIGQGGGQETVQPPAGMGIVSRARGEVTLIQRGILSDMLPDPQEPDTRADRAAKVAVIILSGLIILAVIALVVGGMHLAGGKKAPYAAATSTFHAAAGRAHHRAWTASPGV